MFYVPTQDIYIMNGEDFITILDLDVDLTGCSLYASMKTSYYTANKIDFDIEVIDLVQGDVKLLLPRTQTALIKPKRYVYNIMVVDNMNKSFPLLRGVAHVEPSAVVIP